MKDKKTTQKQIIYYVRLCIRDETLLTNKNLITCDYTFYKMPTLYALKN